MRALRAPLVQLAACVAIALLPCSAVALPPGRLWTGTDTLLVEGDILAAPRLEFSHSNGLRMIAARNGLQRNIVRLGWMDDHWRLLNTLDYKSGFLWPFLADDEEEHLIWKGIEPADPEETRSYLLYLQTIPGLNAIPDTIAATWSSALEYAGAASSTRSWIITDDFGDVRLWTARRPNGAWREIAFPGDGSSGNGSYGVTIDVIGDSSAIALWSDGAELHSALVQADTISLVEVPRAKKGSPTRPRLQMDARGVPHAFWATGDDSVFTARFIDGRWADALVIQCAHPNSDQYVSGSMDVSSTRGSLPVISWTSYSTRTGREVICVSCPTHSGYPTAEVISNTNDGVLASPARDGNGDVWLAWWNYGEGVYWLHSYTSVAVTDAFVDGSPFRRRIAWSLSDSAPQSWWSILRAEDDTMFAVVGRVQAGDEATVEWTDSTTTDLNYSYRIRRDCLDVRYALLTEPIVSTVDGLTWLPLGLYAGSGNPVRGDIRLRVEGAAPGPVGVELFDVRGRRIGTVSGVAGSAGTAVLDVGTLASLGANATRGSGLYFARARDVRGRTSRTLKLVVL